MQKVDTAQLERDVKEIARLRGISEDNAIVEVVALFAPVYINQLKKEND
ncbi:hypothetical protein SH601_05515 [Gracilibacillus sp. S3-1-1]|uniref:Uncharacterized protein n=1 Tax=Gracilibacillus pellucidus TaxID=3095368 RepID=A0ACC6M3I9_9BACI|nr:hypothetical protein [Gracilibacillus sp. S3-1-1]MDX8045443.1 hypothetical protein [Gracilibacillus sp. S3-1-1]